jgi:hypothetical protein
MPGQPLITVPVGLHMGALHPVETVLTLVLAFGPFVVLAVVIAVRRRHEREEPPAAGRPDRAPGERVDAEVESE